MAKPPGRNDPCPCGSAKKYKHCCQLKSATPSSPPAGNRDLLQAALAHHQAGRIPEAEQAYRSFLTAHPGHGDACYLLGLIVERQEATDEAEQLFTQAIEGCPDNPTYRCRLANLLANRGKWPAAETAYRQALALKADFLDAWNNLGNALRAQGKANDALDAYRRALRLAPGIPEIHNNIGCALRDQSRPREAIQTLREAIHLRPEYAEAHSNLGNAFADCGDAEEAIGCYRKALALHPGLVEAHYNLARALTDHGALTEAIAHCRQALSLHPNCVEAMNNLGYALLKQGAASEARDWFLQALSLAPDYPEALYNLANSAVDLGDRRQAIEHFRRALVLRPGYGQAWNNLGLCLQSEACLEQAADCFRQALACNPDDVHALNNIGLLLTSRGAVAEAIPFFRRALAIQPAFVDAHNNLIFALDLAEEADSSELFDERRRWEARFAAPLYGNRLHANSPDPDRKLRIGYVSADFRQHSAATGFGAMLTSFDSTRFEVFAYANQRKDDDLSARFRTSVNHWRPVAGLSDEALAELIRSDAIDILVDLSGFTAGNRLLVFARKPAPIQITAWGYATGTGLRAMDVLFSDPVVVPPAERQFHTEDVRYLPNMFGAFFPEPFPESGPSPAAISGTITFGSLNRLAKITDSTLASWSRILHALPESRLVLKSSELDDPATQAQIVDRFASAGIAAGRLDLIGRTPWLEHVATYQNVDIALDPFPHGGGITTLEAVAMGVPVVTLHWPTVAGRLSSSILTTLDATEWIADSPEHYTDIALRLASAPSDLGNTRNRLTNAFRQSIFARPDDYARTVEREYRTLWRNWCMTQKKP